MTMATRCSKPRTSSARTCHTSELMVSGCKMFTVHCPAKGLRFGFTVAQAPRVCSIPLISACMPGIALMKVPPVRGFGPFGDNGRTASNSWNEYTAIAAQSFTPVYMGPKLITTSKHWEAVREGVQDYEYLRMLANAIAKRKKEGDDSSQILEAEKLVKTLASQVVNQAVQQDGLFYVNVWSNHSTFADTGRLKALHMLKQLNRKQAN